MTEESKNEGAQGLVRRFVEKVIDSLATSIGVSLVLTAFFYISSRDGAPHSDDLKLTKNSLELSHRQEAAVVTQNAFDFATLYHDVADLQKQVSALSHSSTSGPSTAAPEAVPQSVLKAASIVQQLSTPVELEGAVFIGNVTDQSKPNFDQDSLAVGTTGASLIKPEDITVGMGLTAKTALALRKNFPNDDPSYYRGQPLLAVINAGQVITVTVPPKKYRVRSKKDQYWIMVKAKTVNLEP